ncbi:AEC family transporter [Anthocerotibacter panamensis]|uniref:AEC family transporter n=1 Tax=Anthocerotibacter panamensis TaxID=2857077 RepID=UPI001C402A0C|nr:AEC family transporter [Anthocerotibacter panamensis]
MDLATLLKLYLPLLGWGLFGWLLSWVVPKWAPRILGLGLFWVGVPLVIFNFLRRADLTGPVWLAGVVAMVAVTWGLCLGGGWLVWGRQGFSRQAQGSFLLTATMGNTGYLGFPVILALAPQYFGWAVLYDVVGTVWGNFGGAVLASYHGQGRVVWNRLLRDVGFNPVLWAFALTYLTRSWPAPLAVMAFIDPVAHAIILLTLVLLGLRLGGMTDGRPLSQILPALGIKMFLVPLGVALGCLWLGWQGGMLEVVVLQAGMPSAFSTLLLSEAYGLDQELTAVIIALGTLVVMATLPLWLWWLN